MITKRSTIANCVRQAALISRLVRNRRVINTRMDRRAILRTLVLLSSMSIRLVSGIVVLRRLRLNIKIRCVFISLRLRIARSRITIAIVVFVCRRLRIILIMRSVLTHVASITNAMVTRVHIRNIMIPTIFVWLVPVSFVFGVRSLLSALPLL